MSRFSQNPLRSLLLLVALLLTACIAPPATTPVTTTTTDVTAPAELAPLRVVTSFQISSMDPIEDGFWMPEFGVGELLMQFRADGQHHPWLLESLDRTDDLTWVLTLRTGITFQNGKPLDADALLALMERQLALSPSAQSDIPAGTTLAKTGDLQITLTTPTPYPTLPSSLASESVFPVYDTEVVEAASEDFAQLVGSGLYTGPYAVVSLDEQTMVLERYDGYWQGRPVLPGVSVRFVTDPQARILAVQNNEADIALYPPTAAKPVVDSTPGIHFNYGTPSTGGFLLVLNLAEAPFNELAVRQAIMRAVNYDEIANAVMDGVFLPAHSFYPPFFEYAVENQQTDLAAANQLLDEAGWVRGADGVRAKDGQRLHIILLIYPQQPDLVPVSGAMQSQLLEAGFEVEIQSVDSINDAMLENTVPWQAGLVSSGSVSFGGAPEPSLRRYWTSDGDRNYGGYANAEVDELTAQLSATLDEDARTQLLNRLQEILIVEDPYAFFVTFHTGRVVVNDAYQDYQPGFQLYHISWQTQPAPWVR